MNVLHLLRNEKNYRYQYEAVAALQQFLANRDDGEVAIAAFGSGSEPGGIVLGVRHMSKTELFLGGSSLGEMTTEKFTNLIKQLSSEAEGASADGNISVKVSQAEGKLKRVTVTSKDIASAKLLGDTTDDDTKDTAFGKIAKVLKEIDTLKQNIASDLNVTDTKQSQQFVTEVSQKNGKISVSRAAFTSTDKSITLSDTTDGGINASVNVDGSTIFKDPVSGTLSAITYKPEDIEGVDAIKVAENKISLKINDTDNVLTQTADGVLANIKLENVTESLPENVKERYKLVGKNNTVLGKAIDIYKDSSLKSVELVDSKPTESGTTNGQFLKFVYNTAKGSEDTVYVDVSKFLTESEFKNGFNVATSGEVSIKINDNSKKILTVDANGLAIDSTELTNEVKSGASTVADEKINALHVDAIEKADATKGYVKTTLSQTNGLVSNDKVDVTYGDYNKKQNGIATTEDTKAYIDVKIAASAIGAEVDGTYLKSTTEGNTVKISANAKPLTVGKAGGVSTLSGEADSLVDSSEMATKVSSFVNSRISESVGGLTNTVTGESTDKKVSVSVTQTDGKLASVDVTTKGLEVDTSGFASTSALAQETASRKKVTGINGDTYTAPTTSTYIKGATSMNDADIKLDGAIKSVANDQLTKIDGSDAVTVSAKSGKVQKVSIKLDTETSDNALKVNAGKGLYLSSVIDCGTFDI